MSREVMFTRLESAARRPVPCVTGDGERCAVLSVDATCLVSHRMCDVRNRKTKGSRAVKTEVFAIRERR